MVMQMACIIMKTTKNTRTLLLTLGLVAAPMVAFATNPPYIARQAPIFGGGGISLQPRADFESIGQREARGVVVPPQYYTMARGVVSPRVLAAATAEYPEVVVEPAGVIMTNNRVASSAINPDASTQAIRETVAETRAETAAEIERRMEISARALDLVKTRSGGRVESQPDLAAAIQDAETRQAALRSSLNAAQRASASEWPNLRPSLTTEFEAYARSVERVETLGSTSQVIQVK